jgi:hypothetical protein
MCTNHATLQRKMSPRESDQLRRKLCHFRSNSDVEDEMGMRWTMLEPNSTLQWRLLRQAKLGDQLQRRV